MVFMKINMGIKKNILFFMCALYILSLSVLTAESNTVPDYILKSLFNDNLKTEESASIAKGEIVVRNIGNYKKICLNEVSDKVAEILVCYKKLKPAYLYARRQNATIPAQP